MSNRLLNIGKWAGIALVTTVFLFLLSAWAGSMIPRNADWEEPTLAGERSVTVLVGSNGVHTEIAMPIATPEKDWSAVFPASDIEASERPYTHVAVSWGERKFFLETPTWSQMNPLTAIRAMTGGEAVLHVAHYVRPAPASDYRELRLRPEEYSALVASVESHLIAHDTREVIPGYARHDVFYTARGIYHLGNTCNQWTADQLAAAGVRVGAWTPLPGGVMQWVPELPKS